MQPSLRIGVAAHASLAIGLGMVLLRAPDQSHAEARAKTQAQKAAPLTQKERAAHALNRLTFGPGPGDVERVQAMGVRKWIDLQLHPERIDDSALDARLKNYPATAMSLDDLVRKFPPPPIIRAVEAGRVPLPGDPVERAIYQNQIFDFETRQQKKEGPQAANQPAMGAMNKDQAAAGGPQMGASTPAATDDSTAAAAGGSTAGAGPRRSAPESSGESMALEEAARSPSMSIHEQKLYADLQSTEIVNLPADERWNKLVAMPPQDFRNFMRDLSNPERVELTQGMTPRQREVVFALINPNLVLGGELLQTRLLRDIYSQRQLQAVMIDFWLNHFNVYLQKGPFAPAYLIDYERNAIAPNAMGKFEDLLVATAKSPAMLFYLDNHTSIGPDSVAALRAAQNPNAKYKDLGLNENYARELMELHTLGVDGGYTQKDVVEVAKVFTGWTIEDPRNGGGFTFNPRRHEPGPKYVLGHTIQSGGEEEGLAVLHLLAASPATARHLSQELAARFVSDDPPPALVNRMVKTYLKSGGDIRQVLRTMFESPEFWSPSVYRAKVKTPEEFVISAVRATGGDVLRPALAVNALNELGMPFYGCQTPNGYSWSSSAWLNAGDLLDRMNISMALAGNRLGSAIDIEALLKTGEPESDTAGQSTGQQTPEQMEDALAHRLFDGQLTDDQLAALLHQISEGVDQFRSGAQASSSPPENAGAPSGAGPSFTRRAAIVQMLDLPQPIAPPRDKQEAMVAGLLLGSPQFQKK